MSDSTANTADDLVQPAGTAAALGYRMPAEFEPIDAVWLTYPQNPETWPGCLDEAKQQYDAMIDAVARFTRLQVIGRDHDIPTDDSWIRDYGPIFVVRSDGATEAPATAPLPALACHDFAFNCWGEKYEPYVHDDTVPRRVARLLGLPIWLHDFVLEGGSIDVNGRGTVMTTEQCLLNANRNPHLSRAQIEQALHDALGTRHVIWLPGGIEGDDTDGHVDDVARFIAPDTVAALRAPPGHPDHAVLERNWQALQAARDQDGRRLNLLELPVPEPIFYDYPTDRFGTGGRKPLPASHANFLFVNRGLLVPTFGGHSDDAALRALARALPAQQVVPVRCERLVVGLGGIHCLSQQQPRPPRS